MPDQTTAPAVSYELCFDPSDADMLVYRSIRAGICGPFSESIPCTSREQAERIAFDMGYLVSGDWQGHANFDSAPLVRMA
jgi:hypothetical protein